MSDTAIQVERLSKQYKINAAQQRYDTLRDQLVYGLKGVFRRSGQSNPGEDTIWALKDVSFEVKQGEVLGIIGRNGAGKSTLLKILSRITEPTEGYAEIRGRVGSLLEVGTGFHPELTGRENIYLNGAILGMKKAEIDRKFDEIVAFAEVEKFMDTPVKRYSSGMYVRLAFAVAAHLEPEILLVDEVLAVGDAAFQKKCLGKMGDVATEGRTVLFVSHNMGAIQRLCLKAILLDRGRLVNSGEPHQVVRCYLEDNSSATRIPLLDRHDRKGDGSLRFTSLYFTDSEGRQITDVRSGDDLSLVICYMSQRRTALSAVDLGVAVFDAYGQYITGFYTSLTDEGVINQLPAEGEVLCHIPRFPLIPGRYHLKLSAAVRGSEADTIEDAAILDVTEGDFYRTGRSFPQLGRSGVMIDHKWQLPNGF